MNEKILTLCTSAYNAEKYISRMIDSVVKACNSNLLQLVIVNDGSTDKTQDIIKEYVLQYPEIINSVETKNGGSGAGRNKAFSLARGKYIGLLDADDYVRTEYLDAFIEFLRNIDADVIYNNFYKYYISTGKYEYINHVDADNFKEKTLSFCNNHPIFMKNDRQEMQGTVYKNELFISNKFELTEGISYVDAEFITIPYKWIKSYAVADFPYYVYCIGVPGQSVAQDVSIKKNAQRKKLIDKLLSDYSMNEKEEFPQSIKERVEKNIANLYMDYINNYLYTCDYKYREIVLEEIESMRMSYPSIYVRTSVGGRMKSVNRFGNIGYTLCMIYGAIKKIIKGQV